MKLLKTSHRGFYNRYHTNMPLFDTFLKDLNYFWLKWKNFFRNGGKHKTIFIHPHYPSRGSTIYKVGEKLGYNLSNKANKNFDFAVYWEYNTFREEYQQLEKIAEQHKVVNLYNRNISKIYIDEIHQRVFGYSTQVDPLSFQGKMVRKSEINALHDGAIIEGPIDQVEEGFIYQILIDNAESGMVKDIRLPVVGQPLDWCYLKYRPENVRFTNQTAKAKKLKTSDLLNETEIQLIDEFCQKLNLEYGELDVLRDQKDGKIYIVDVNNTPQGPPKNISKNEGREAIQSLGVALMGLVNNH